MRPAATPLPKQHPSTATWRFSSGPILAALAICLAGVPNSASADVAATTSPTARPATATSIAALSRQVVTEQRTIEGQLDRLKARIDAFEVLSVARGRAYVRLARAGLLPVGGGFHALLDHASRLERLRRAVGNDLATIERLTAERGRLASKLAALKDQSAALEQEQATLARSHAAIAAAEEREQAFRRAFMSSWQPDHTAVYGSGAGPVSGSDVQAGFGRLKGRLPFPLAGRAEIRRLQRGGSEAGLQMLAPAGAPVRAVFPGRVAFADSYADYGHTVIIQHGEGYYTVSGQLGSIDVRAGEEVAAGDVLGTVGASEQGAALYFEVRKGTQTLDPSEWFGI